jgi:hypothetical protein
MYQNSFQAQMNQRRLQQQQEDTLRAQQQYYQAAAQNLNNQNYGRSYAYQPAPYVDPVYQQPMPHCGHYGYPGYIDPYTYQMMVMAAMANGLGGEPDIY